MKQLSRNESNKIQKFVDENLTLEFKLTNHVFDRLRGRMGWGWKVSHSHFPKRTIGAGLTEGMVELAKGGGSKIHL